MEIWTFTVFYILASSYKQEFFWSLSWERPHQTSMKIAKSIQLSFTEIYFYNTEFF